MDWSHGEWEGGDGFNWTFNGTDNLIFSEIDISEQSYDLGPKRDPLYVVIPMSVIYGVIFLTGLVGNVSTCIVIARNKSMHTATNYYLFSLAISDLLLLVSGLPQEIYYIWSKYPYIFGEIFCIMRGLAAETSANATVLTITAFTVERYVAICHPFLSHTMSKLTRAIKLILVIWLVALAFAIPQALQFGLMEHQRLVLCVQTKVLIEHSFEISTFLFFLTPMTLISVLYALIGLRLRHSSLMKEKRIKTNKQRFHPHSGSCRHATGQSSRRVLKMLVAVVVAFFICWAPFHVQRLVAIYGTNDNHQASSSDMLIIYAITTYISGVLYYLSTTINPVLYHIMSNKFREAFKETLARCCRRGGAVQRRRYSALSRGAQPPNSSDYTGNSIREDNSQSAAIPLGGRFGSMNSPHNLARNNNRSFVASDQHKDRAHGSMRRNHAVITTNGSRNSYRAVFRNNNVQWEQGGKMSEVVNCHARGSTRPRVDRKKSVWQLLDCLDLRAGGDSAKSSPYTPPRGSRFTTENEPQTESEAFSMVPCNISNSSLKDVEKDALEDELTTYMEELQRRQLQLG